MRLIKGPFGFQTGAAFNNRRRGRVRRRPPPPPEYFLLGLKNVNWPVEKLARMSAFDSRRLNPFSPQLKVYLAQAAL